MDLLGVVELPAGDARTYFLKDENTEFLASLDKSMNILETERLFLQSITQNDAKFYLELMNTPKWYKFIGDRKIYSVEQAAVYIQERMVSQWETHGYGNYILRSKKEPLKAIGACGLFIRQGLEGCDLGFALLPSAEKQGYAFEASKCIIEHAFKDLNINFINAITSIDNTDCQKLLELLGFIYEGNMLIFEIKVISGLRVAIAVLILISRDTNRNSRTSDQEGSRNPSLHVRHNI